MKGSDVNELETQLKELQESMAVVELLNRPPRGGRYMEILLKKLEYIQIRMEGDKAHENPHVHINIGKNTHAASYEIKTGNRIAGTNSHYDKTVSQWVKTRLRTH